MFTNMADAVKWGVRFGSYPNYGASRTAYMAVRTVVQPQTARDMWAAWWQHCNDVLEEQGSEHVRDPLEDECMAAVYGYDGPFF